LGVVLGTFLEQHTFDRGLGPMFGPGAPYRLRPGLVRMPDLSFVGWDRLPERRIPREPIASIVPDLAVEILTSENTAAEMARKRRDYFQAGVRQVWMVDGETRQVQVYQSVRKFRTYGDGDTVSGGRLLPGFELAVTEYFVRAGLRA
jgi:Uma2 family endonuclease